jgi:protein-S-isoprenylcysteine O-methyltransferase Ste14
MWLVVRQLIAIVVFPGTVTILIPIWIARRYAVVVPTPTTPLDLAAVAAGAVLAGIGFMLFFNSLRRFHVDGQGTLAPWDAPRRLVVAGPYRYVRNPMISGVIMILGAEALLLQSGPHGWWAAVFVAINATYIPLLEEPILEMRFGPSYVDYRRHVPRLVPRLRPWTGRGADASRKGAP